MNCQNCKKIFYVKRSFLTLFLQKHYYICDHCRSEYPIQLKIEHIPLEIYEAVVISMFPSKIRMNFNAYILEIEKIVSYFVIHHPSYFFVFLDYVFINDLWLEQFNFLSLIEKKPILILCLQLRN